MASTWQSTAQTLSAIVAAIAVPLAIAYFANTNSFAVAERGVQAGTSR